MLSDASKDQSFIRNYSSVLSKMKNAIIITEHNGRWKGGKFNGSRALFIADTEDQAISKAKAYKFKDAIYLHKGFSDVVKVSF